MKKNKYFPKFIAKWNKNKNGIEVFALRQSLTFEGMDVQTIMSIEKTCSGKNCLEEVVKKLSKKWETQEVVALLDLLIEKQVIINLKEINSLTKKVKLKKLETVLSNTKTLDLLKLPYSVIYGRAGRDVWSSGKDTDINVATSKLISEIAEWNAWFFPNQKDVVIGSLNYLKRMNKVIYPTLLTSYNKIQYHQKGFPFKLFKESEDHVWISAKSLKDNKPTLVCANHVLFNCNSTYTNTTSSGCSAHIIKGEAIRHAVYELVERDAFMIYWLNKLDRDHIKLDSLPEGIRFRVKSIENLGYRLVVVDITMDISPVIMICVQDKDGVYVTSGMSSGDSIDGMIHSALCEVEVSLMHVLNSKKNRKKIYPKMVKSLTQHELLHQQLRYKKETSFIFGGKKEILYSDIINKYENQSDIIKELFSKGFDIYIVDATNWELDVLLPEKRYIIKVLIPGLIPLSYGYGQEPLGMERVYMVPVKLGFCKNTILYKNLNKFPHPFN